MVDPGVINRGSEGVVVLLGLMPSRPPIPELDFVGFLDVSSISNEAILGICCMIDVEGIRTDRT